VDIVIRDDDTLTVKYNGATVDFTSTRESYFHSYGSPSIVTVQRNAVTVRRGTEYNWRVSFASGGHVDVWPTNNAGNKQGNDDENMAMWMWINVPATLANQATGVCTASCPYNPPMPYNWCEGDANCLPTRVDATLFTSSEVTALESACGFNSGDSQRPNICINRSSTLEVDCGYLSGSVNVNFAVHKKWPKNLDLFNGRHSGTSTGCDGSRFEGYVSCPSTHPYAYQPPNFNYCCATANDNAGNVGINAVNPPSGRAITCEGHNWNACPTPPCVDYQPTLCPPTHPFAFNPPTFDQCCASPNDDSEFVAGANARFPRSGRSTTCRGNSQPCITPPCDDSFVNTTATRTLSCPYTWNMPQYADTTDGCIADGVCDSGTCHANGCRSGSYGGGGCVEDPDCEYSYTLRDIPIARPMSSNVPHQDCWDYCTNYVLSGSSRTNRCKARRLLANGGQLFCGYKGGSYVSIPSPNTHRCHVFVFTGDVTSQDYYNGDIMGPDPPLTTSTSFPYRTSFASGSASTGPFSNFYMTESPCNTNLDATCAPESAELCNASGTTLAAAQLACAAFTSLPFYLLVTWGTPSMATVHENVHCPAHTAQSGQYICAVYDGGYTKMVGYTISAYDATPAKLDGRYYSNSAVAIGTAQEVADAWDNTPTNRRGYGYEVSEFIIVNEVNRPRPSPLPSVLPCSLLPPPPPPLLNACVGV
jgi:hypothetical protein